MSRQSRENAQAAVGCFILFYWLFCFALTIGVIVVAIHFVGKYW